MLTFHFFGQIYYASLDVPAMPSMYGPAFNDLNRNGIKDSGETHDTPYTIFFDINLDGIANSNEPSYPLNYDRPDYQFPLLEPGTYVVRALPQINTTSDYYRSRVAWPEDSITVTLDYNQRLEIPLPYYKITSRSGVVRHDTNLNDSPNTTEPGLPDRIVYADLNSDGIRNAEEPYRVTNAAGYYYFRDLPVGQYPLRVELAPGWYTSYPIFGTYNLAVVLNVASYDNAASFAITNQVPRGYVTGSLFADVNRNGTKDVGESAPPSLRVWLDLDLDGALDIGEPSTTSSSYSFPTFSTQPVQLSFDYPNWQATTTTGVTLAPGERIVRDLGIAVSPLEQGGIGGKAFFDANGNGLFDTGEAAHTRALVWLDDDLDLLIDANELRCTTDIVGAFSINGAGAGSHSVRWLLSSASYTPTTLDADFNPINVAVDPFSPLPAAADLKLGSRLTLLSERVDITAARFVDSNRNGSREPSEGAFTALNVTYFLDIDANGALGGSDPAYSGSSTLRVAPNRYVMVATVVIPSTAGWIRTTPSSLQTILRPGQPLTTVQFGFAWPGQTVTSAVHMVDAAMGVIEFALTGPFYNADLHSAIQILDAGGQSISISSILSIGTNRYRVTPVGSLAEGVYTFRIFGAALAGTDLPVPQSYEYGFHVLRGDLNLDRRIDFDDLLLLAQNYGQSGRTYSQGNLTRDGVGAVDFDDLLLLAQRYGVSLSVGTATPSAKRRTTTRFLI